MVIVQIETNRGNDDDSVREQIALPTDFLE